MKKIKVAQIGTSRYSHGSQIFPCVAQMTDVFEVVGYALPENEREKFPLQVKVFDGYPELTVDEILNNPEIDAVIVETEEIYLTKYALMVAKAGKHLHMEKPGSQSLADFEELIETVRKNNIVFHTGYMYRYNPAVKELIERIDAGELGQIISVEAEMSCTHDDQWRQWLSSFKGGLMFFLGCHLVDLIYRIQGMPEKITPLNRATNLNGVTAEDFGMAVFEYKNGVSVAKTTDVEYGGFVRRHLTVVGSKGTVEIRPLEYGIGGGLQKTTSTEFFKADWGDTGTVTDSEPATRYGDMMISFAAMVRGEKENPYTLDYELELYKLVLKSCGVE